MTAKDIYIQLAAGQIPVSTALAYSLVYVHLTQEDLKWVQVEINGYPTKESIPDYRQITCEIKASVQNIKNGFFQEIRLKGGSLQALDSMLRKNYNLTIYEIYVSQAVESIEQLLSGHNDGDFIMPFEGGPADDLKDSLKIQEKRYGFTTINVYQSAPLAYLQHSLSVIKSKLILMLKKYIDQVGKESSNLVDNPQRRKVIFISYCWESEEHKKWVRHLAEDLSSVFDIRIDQELPLGCELTTFMEQAIAQSDKVLIIATPEYKRRADNRIRGVGYETSLITDDLVTDQNRIKFIPIIRKGTKEESYPRYLGSRKGADMTDDQQYHEVLEVLKDNLLKY